MSNDNTSIRELRCKKPDMFPFKTFILPEYSWSDNFFSPLVTVQDAFLKKYSGYKTAEEFIKYARLKDEL